jgi:hypothetical protein
MIDCGSSPIGKAPVWTRVALCWVALALGSGSCASVKPAAPADGGGQGKGGGAGSVNRADGGVRPDAPAALDLNCTPASCTPAGGQYCGVIGDNCQGTIDCGACSGDQICDQGLCRGGPSCVASSSCAAATGGVNFCGDIGNGCGGKVACGTCAAGSVCHGGLCVAANCVPLTCNIAAGGRYCGKIGDGCGGTLDCSCDAPETCGGTGVPNVCGDPACVPITCNPMGGGQYCGDIGNGCGKPLSCAAGCPNGVACPANHVCPSTGAGTCVGLQCQIDKCTAGGQTTLSGTVYDPAGVNPLYNVVVYVPNQPLGDIASGASCDTCASPVSGQPVAAALTDGTGHFVMQNVPSPAGVAIPVVVQIGKWRRQIMIPPIRPCVDNPIGGNLLRLPRSQAEGHLPKIALATGHSDSLDCLMRKIGVDDSEFTNDAGTGRVQMFVGGDGGSGTGANRLASGAVFADAYSTLYANYAKLAGYDLLILQCEGSQLGTQKDPYIANIRRYADNGGRIFDEHLHSYWIRKGLPPWPTSMVWPTSIPSGTAADPVSLTATVDTTFPKGAALADWLQSVQATTTRGQVPLTGVVHSVDAVVPPTQRWIYSSDSLPLYSTFNTPIEAPAANQCGRVVFTDVHVGTGGGVSHFDTPFPTGCMSTPMSPQEKALEFMFFDLSSCVQVDTLTPTTPPIPPLGGSTPPPNVVSTPPAPPPPPPPPPPPIIP